ncbi:MAG: SAM-dependent methyltransferase, partial [Aphanocapsa feldmannii 277cI]
MARHGTPGLHTHQEWLGLVQPVGLVVAPVVLDRLGLFPEAGTARLADGQRRLKELLKPVQDASDNSLEVVSDFPALLEELLDWQTGDLVEAEVRLDDYNDVLRPTHLVPAIEAEATGGSPWQALVQLLPAGTGFDDLPRDRDTTSGWQATPQQRFERLLKDSEHPLGLLFNGVALRLIHAPRGESSGHITFPLEPMTTVAGRPMLAAMQMLLVADRLFESGNSERRLPVLLAASRKEQNEVSTRLAEQVLEALWELLSGFDQAERLAAEQGRTVLADLATSDPGHIYGGLITVLLRLVFLLYAEDEELMPPDALYGQHYSVSGLAGRLRQERAEYRGGMADRRGAWASLLSLFRLVYDGGGADPAYLPARHGELFDPDAYPFLEGREQGTTYADAVLDNLPAISDDVVEKVLAKLIWLDGERLSYRALDVEQIGSVYEGIMGFQVEQAQAPAVGISYRPPRQKIRITVVVNAAELLAQPGSKRDKWLEDITGVNNLKLPAQVKRNLKEASSLRRTLSPHTPRGLAAGSLVLQPTAERRRSGSHYTPRVLTDPIAAEAFRPWLEHCNGKPTADQVLALKVCDPAMGSGAFLVATCRYLAGHLVAAWEREGFPDEFDESYDKDIYARRLVAQRCLYGVDKNPFAVNLAKLSLWLVTLSKKLPFTFVDHALKCGDSLVGHSVKEIQTATEAVQLAFLDQQNRAYERMGIDRRESFAEDSRDDAIYDRKQVLLEQQIKASDGLRQAGDLMVAAFFDASKRKARAEKQQVYLAMLSGAFDDAGLQDAIEAIRERLAAADQGIRPFHWDLEFPEVFAEERGGFDVFVGNPPFAGKNTIAKGSPNGILDWFKQLHTQSHGNADLVAHFFRRCFDLLRTDGSLGLIATNTIAQGDTRSTGLRWICLNGGTIYSARRRYKWPGVAAVVVSVVQLRKGPYQGRKLLDSRPVNGISAFLFPGDNHEDPRQLAANA